jgi:hypothetical protein
MKSTHSNPISLAQPATYEPSAPPPSRQPAGDFPPSHQAQSATGLAASLTSTQPPAPRKSGSPSAHTSGKTTAKTPKPSLVEKIAKATRKVARKLVGRSPAPRKNAPASSERSFAGPAADPGQREDARPYPKHDSPAKSKRVMATMVGDDLALGLPVASPSAPRTRQRAHQTY